MNDYAETGRGAQFLPPNGISGCFDHRFNIEETRLRGKRSGNLPLLQSVALLKGANGRKQMAAVTPRDNALARKPQNDTRWRESTWQKIHEACYGFC